ncbi:MAG: hypothetical protein QM802_19095 [Agriterribacter sp.]
MHTSSQKPFFSNRIFWDVNPESIDYSKKAAFIIERVFERGDVEDIRQCRRYYGDEILKNVLTNAKWLSLSTICLACALFKNELTDYTCYNTAQLNPAHWMY